MTGRRGKEGTDSVHPSAVRARSDTVVRAMLHAAGADAGIVNRAGSAGDPARLIRLPPSPPNEFAVIEYKATALLSLSLSLPIALPCTIQLSLGGFLCKYRRMSLQRRELKHPLLLYDQLHHLSGHRQ